MISLTADVYPFLSGGCLRSPRPSSWTMKLRPVTDPDRWASRKSSGVSVYHQALTPVVHTQGMSRVSFNRSAPVHDSVRLTLYPSGRPSSWHNHPDLQPFSPKASPPTPGSIRLTLCCNSVTLTSLTLGSFLSELCLLMNKVRFHLWSDLWFWFFLEAPVHPKKNKTNYFLFVFSGNVLIQIIKAGLSLQWRWMKFDLWCFSVLNVNKMPVHHKWSSIHLLHISTMMYYGHCWLKNKLKERGSIFKTEFLILKSQIYENKT